MVSLCRQLSHFHNLMLRHNTSHHEDRQELLLDNQCQGQSVIAD